MLRISCKSIVNNNSILKFSLNNSNRIFCNNIHQQRLYSSKNNNDSIFTKLSDDHKIKVKKQQQLQKQLEEIEQQQKILEGDTPKDIFEEKHLDFFRNVLKNRINKQQSGTSNEDDSLQNFQKQFQSNQDQYQKQQQQQELVKEDEGDEETSTPSTTDQQVYNTLELTRPVNPEETLKEILKRIVINEEFIDLPEERDDIEKIEKTLLPKQLIEEINKASEKKFSEARSLYVSGFHKKSHDIFANEIDKRHGMANVFLGNMYFNGVGGVDQDISAAYRHFQIASQSRIPVAFGMLGEMCLKGMGVSHIDERLARTYFGIAASMGLKSSIEQIVYMIINGIGGEFNLKKASFYLKNLAERGDIQAVVTLGGLLYEHDKKVALSLWTYASQMDNADAMYYLGRHYYSRDNPDYNHSLVLWKRAAELGNINSQFCLGGMYDIGLIVERNSQLAMELYDIAANAGHVDAQFLLGKYYYYGIGVPADHKLGIEYLQMAAKQGDLSAIELIQDITKKIEE